MGNDAAAFDRGESLATQTHTHKREGAGKLMVGLFSAGQQGTHTHTHTHHQSHKQSVCVCVQRGGGEAAKNNLLVEHVFIPDFLNRASSHTASGDGGGGG